MRWALENKSLLIPAFGYEKHRPEGERIKACTKLACTQRGRKGERERERRERERERERGAIGLESV